MAETPFHTRFQVARITRAEPFPETNKPQMMKLWLSLGDDEIQSAAQLGYHYEPHELEGRQVLAATNLGTVNIAGFDSEALTVGVPGDDEHPVLVVPDKHVPDGGILH